MLSAFAMLTMEHVGSVPAVEHRKPITVYSLSNYRSYDLVYSIETELTGSAESMDSGKFCVQGRYLLRSTASSSSIVISAFTEEFADCVSTLCAILDGLWSMFR
jgi:hypothetical protein